MIVIPMNATDDDFDGNRKFNITNNDDGTKGIEDVTEYRNRGTEFGGAEYNNIAAAIQDFTSSTTVISQDRLTITETDVNNRKKVTTIGQDAAGHKRITVQLIDTDESVIGTKVTTINGSTITEEVTL
ncbi:MAG: hypothetical protein J6P79_13985 [Pseudobutyrivibrio sp.]|nr:hypothetical protein [Pseudobutyrivibrio sp.]